MSGSDISEEMTLAMLVERTDAASIESLLRENNSINPQFRIKEYEGKIAIPIKPNSETHIETYDYSLVELPMSKKSSIKSPQQKMQKQNAVLMKVVQLNTRISMCLSKSQ